MKYLLFLSLLLTSCNDNQQQNELLNLPNIKVETEIKFINKNWSGDIIILPTGERILLTAFKFGSYSGYTSYSTTATLLPPLKAEK